MPNTRLDHLYQLLTSSSLPVMVLNPGPTMLYLTGMHFHLMERPTILLFAPPAVPALILPELEMAKVQTSSFPVKPFPFNDNPATWSAAFDKAMEYLGLDGKTVGIEPLRLRALELGFLQSAAPHAKFTPAETVLTNLRIRKDAGEIAAMRSAVQIAQDAFRATVALVKIGMTEREVASELTIQMLRAGSDSENPFAPIVGSGPNSANPHYTPGDRKLQPGDLVVVDWGAYYMGYCSDLTRTLAIGDVEPELAHIARVVADANAAGRAASRPGIPAGKVDQDTRAVIDRAGYGPLFRHRTGHGLGMEGHEPPYMFGENPLILEEGMTFTVEPGIYFLGRGGVRIEDNVVIAQEGAETLSDLPRDLWVIS